MQYEGRFYYLYYYIYMIIGKAMKQYISKLILLAAVLSLSTGCEQENFSELKKDGSLVFTASIADASTRTTIEVDDTYGKVNWVEGDEITVNGVAYVATPHEDNPTIATFTKRMIRMQIRK